MIIPTALRIPFKAWKCLRLKTRTFLSTHATRFLFRINGIKFGKFLRALGTPSVNVSLGGSATIGERFYIRTGVGDTEVGTPGSRIRVGPNGKLRIGDRVGISNATIVCDEAVTIGDDVFLGGGVQVFDTNFHSIDAMVRTSGRETRADVRTAPVSIGARAFIGANALICKGVSIGEEAVVAAGSVVVKSIPVGEIWGGNPARKIK